jgi:hypothetical protein
MANSDNNARFERWFETNGTDFIRDIINGKEIGKCVKNATQATWKAAEDNILNTLRANDDGSPNSEARPVDKLVNSTTPELAKLSFSLYHLLDEDYKPHLQMVAKHVRMVEDKLREVKDFLAREGITISSDELTVEQALEKCKQWRMTDKQVEELLK